MKTNNDLRQAAVEYLVKAFESKATRPNHMVQAATLLVTCPLVEPSTPTTPTEE